MYVPPSPPDKIAISPASGGDAQLIALPGPSKRPPAVRSRTCLGLPLLPRRRPPRGAAPAPAPARLPFIHHQRCTYVYCAYAGRISGRNVHADGARRPHEAPRRHTHCLWGIETQADGAANQAHDTHPLSCARGGGGGRMRKRGKMRAHTPFGNLFPQLFRGRGRHPAACSTFV